MQFLFLLLDDFQLLFSFLSPLHMTYMCMDDLFTKGRHLPLLTLSTGLCYSEYQSSTFLNYSCGILFSCLCLFTHFLVFLGTPQYWLDYTSLPKKIFCRGWGSDVFAYCQLPPLECRLHDIVFSCSLYEGLLMDSELTLWSLSWITFNVIVLLNIGHIG